MDNHNTRTPEEVPPLIPADEEVPPTVPYDDDVHPAVPANEEVPPTVPYDDELPPALPAPAAVPDKATLVVPAREDEPLGVQPDEPKPPTIAHESGWQTPPSVGAENEGEDAFSDTDFLALRTSRRFDINNPPPELEPILSLGDHILCTGGNLSVIQGGAKSCKTAVLESIMASTMPLLIHYTGDTLGFSSSNPDNLAVIHIDTEQSAVDHFNVIKRALDRAKIEKPPKWFSSYYLTGEDPSVCCRFLDQEIEQAVAACGGVLMILLDGIADLCVDPNDAHEAFALVRHLHALAIEHNCAIVSVLHENPGSDYGKTRGHLGSQLERKAETPLRLKKQAATGIVTMWADRARHCFIPLSEGYCFAYDEDKKMHLSCGDAKRVKEDSQFKKFSKEVKNLELGAASFKYTELCERIVSKMGVKQPTAKKRVTAYFESALLEKLQDGRYRLAGESEQPKTKQPTTKTDDKNQNED